MSAPTLRTEHVPVEVSEIIDQAARARGWNDAILAANAGVSGRYIQRLRNPDGLAYRPSPSVAAALVDSLALEGEHRHIVLEASAQ